MCDGGRLGTCAPLRASFGWGRLYHKAVFGSGQSGSSPTTSTGEAEVSPAPQAELRVWRVLVLASRTLHHEIPGPRRLTLHRGGVKHGPPLRLRLLLSSRPV